MKQKGMFWHEYHNGWSLTYCSSYDGRIRDIEKYKPKHEIKPRIKYFQPIKGRLPQEVVIAAKEITKVYDAYEKAHNAYKKAEQAYVGTGRVPGEFQAHDKAWYACVRAYHACIEAGPSYDKVVRKYEVEIAALHKKECPNCTWNGEELVFDK